MTVRWLARTTGFTNEGDDGGASAAED